jgi:hypothetical protein
MNEEKRVARGRVFKVENMDRVFGESLTYNFVAVEDCRIETERTIEDKDGNVSISPKEYALLFTDHEIAVAKARAERNKEDLLSKDYLTDLTDGLF